MNDLLIKMLTSTHEYWVVEKRDIGIFLVGIPLGIKQGIAYEDLLIKDIVTFGNMESSNICINKPYPPFQYGQMYNEFSMGFALKCHPMAFLKEALSYMKEDQNMYTLEKLAVSIWLAQQSKLKE